MPSATTGCIADGAVARRASDAPCITSSFQAECVVLVHMLRESPAGHPGAVPRHGASLRETYAYRDELARAVGAEPRQPARGRAAAGLWQTRAPTPAARATRWSRSSRRSRTTTSGSPALRREQSPSRANLAEVEPFTLPCGKSIRKVSPLARWTTKDVWAYAKAHDIPLLPLYELGYTSIGCEPCTSLPLDPVESAIGPLAGPEAGMRDPHPGEIEHRTVVHASEGSPQIFLTVVAGDLQVSVRDASTEPRTKR